MRHRANFPSMSVQEAHKCVEVRPRKSPIDLHTVLRETGLQPHKLVRKGFPAKEVIPPALRETLWRGPNANDKRQPVRTRTFQFRVSSLEFPTRSISAKACPDSTNRRHIVRQEMFWSEVTTPHSLLYVPIDGTPSRRKTAGMESALSPWKWASFDLNLMIWNPNKMPIIRRKGWLSDGKLGREMLAEGCRLSDRGAIVIARENRLELFLFLVT